MIAALLIFLLAEKEPRHALVFAMLLSYALGFAGMLLAYLSYRRRHGQQRGKDNEKAQP